MGQQTANHSSVIRAGEMLLHRALRQIFESPLLQEIDQVAEKALETNELAQLDNN